MNNNKYNDEITCQTICLTDFQTSQHKQVILRRTCVTPIFFLSDRRLDEKLARTL